MSKFFFLCVSVVPSVKWRSNHLRLLLHIKLDNVLKASHTVSSVVRFAVINRNPQNAKKQSQTFNNSLLLDGVILRPTETPRSAFA